MRRALLTCVVSIAALAAPATAAAAPGDRDPSFSADGLTTWGTPDGVADLAVGADGSIVVAQNTNFNGSVASFAPDGALQWSTNESGLGAGDDTIAALALRPDGQIIVAGSAPFPHRGFAVSELTAHGTPACGTPGPCFESADFGDGVHKLTDVAVAPSGKVVAAGIVPDGATKRMALVRYRPDGSLDTSFAGDGMEVFNEGGSATLANRAAVTVLADDSVLLAGAGPGPDGTATGDLVLAKYDDLGALDTGFDDDGWTSVDIRARDDAGSIAVDPAGRILVGIDACAFGLHTSCDYVVARFTPEGGLDPAFAAGGIAQGLPGSQVVATQEGGALAAGVTAPRRYFGTDFALARLTPAGALDPGFSEDGVATADFDLEHDHAIGLTHGVGSRVVVGGSATVRDGATVGLAAFTLADGPPDADADGRLDAADRCPERYAKTTTGCPKIKRKLKLKRAGKGVRAKVKTPIDLCAAKQRLKLIEVRRGPDRAVSKPKTSRGGGWRSARLDPGRYRAKAKARIGGEIGGCAAAKSKRVRVR